MTIADGQQTQAPGELTWPIVRALCAGVVTVSDDELLDAMRFAFERLKIVLEPSGASALAAALIGRDRRRAASGWASRSAAGTSTRAIFAR